MGTVGAALHHVAFEVEQRQSGFVVGERAELVDEPVAVLVDDHDAAVVGGQTEHARTDLHASPFGIKVHDLVALGQLGELRPQLASHNEAVARQMGRADREVIHAHEVKVRHELLIHGIGACGQKHAVMRLHIEGLVLGAGHHANHLPLVAGDER